MAVASITTNADLLTYDYALPADIGRLAPSDDPVGWWAARHVSGWRMVLDDLALRGIAEADLSSTDNLMRPAACWTMRMALVLGSNGFDQNTDDGKRRLLLDAEFKRLMDVVSVAITALGNAMRRRGGVTTVRG